MWFSYDPNGDGMVFHVTHEAAQKAASKAFDAELDYARDSGWTDEVGQICWGVVKERVSETLRKTKPPQEQLDAYGYDEDGQNWNHFDEYVECQLLPVDAPEE